jgi:PAS domain S-box-containing protein
MTHEHPVLLPDGTQGWQQWTNRAILDESGGRILEVQAVGRDITVRKRAEEQMLVANERLQYLLSSTSVVIYTAKSSGDYGTTFISSNVAQVVGYDPERFIGDSKFWYDRVHPEDRVIVSEEVPRVFEKELHAYEYRFRCRDGRYIWVRDEMKLVRDHNGDPLEIIGFWLDVTDRKCAEEEREKLRVRLLQAQKMESVGRLAGGLAHDFNNVLSAILGHAELAMMHCTPSEPIRADLKEIQNAAQRSAGLIQQLLAFARKQTVWPKVLDLNHTLAGMLKMLQRLIGENIDLVWIPGAGLWLVKIDPSQIDQLMTNLCVNARDAITGVGKVTIETENTAFDEAYCAVHPGFACGEYVTLTVSDNGCGIRKEVIDHLFEPFFTTKEVGKGTGLGLATVHGIVRQNGGFINVHSEPDKGTTFKISLPRFAGEAVEPAAESAAETPRGRGETVLLVEDDAATLKVGRAMLEGLGYTVLTAGMPGEALRQAEAHAAEIRLLITDVIMPEMNGRALAKLIGDIKPGLKCLFISGYTSDIVARHGVLDEGVCFLQKPFSLRELASKVRQAFECE